MLHGEKVILRGRQAGDIAVLEAGLHADVETWSRADTRPWRPITPGTADSPFAVDATNERNAVFSVVERASGELAGDAILWAIDPHNRMAHIGIALLSSFRGKGLGADVVRVLCRYGFETRGMHRIQMETLAENNAMIKAAVKAGFAIEGTLRQSAWANGEFLDEVILGQLADAWRQRG
jgi:RimJ/RimL family protein N-acetyltransferase